MIAGLGSIVGPLIGGVTAKPTESLLLKSLFHKGSMWETYPYALPGLIVSVYCVFSIIITIIYMKESPKKYQKLGKFSSVKCGIKLFDSAHRRTFSKLREPRKKLSSGPLIFYCRRS